MLDFSVILWYNYGMENDTKVAVLEARIKELELQVQWLLEQLKLSKQRQYGTSSEQNLDCGEQLTHEVLHSDDTGLAGSA